ncbi:MAG: hypothetical protein sGL2_10880 [Candidatus Mesenet longicola]|nr:MAG: hypothetical protein sGL2_10880 [Candidatus Mesenet longicola]
MVIPALHLATYENHIKVVEVLIRNGANIDAKKQNSIANIRYKLGFMIKIGKKGG